MPRLYFSSAVGLHSVTRGYRNRHELNAAKFLESPYCEGRLYKTGDLARWTSDGQIAYLGRADAQVKLRGTLAFSPSWAAIAHLSRLAIRT